jgi:serine kinase of HPr protein (carbohydrate metabolism regulator)
VSAAAHIQVHASCVAWNGTGLLLRGPSGAGKSDLALRLLERGAVLVADDRVDLRRAGSRVLATAPRALAGLIEVRGVGIVRRRHLAQAPVGLIVDLVAADAVERLPEPRREALLGMPVPRIALDPFAGSTPAKIMIALEPGAVLPLDDAATAA